MSRSVGRCAVVWLFVSALALGMWVAVAKEAASLASSSTWRGTFDDLLVAVASAALIGCAGWMWLVTTATVLDLLRGRVPTTASRGLTRRLVVAACGAAFIAGVSGPAMAASSSGDHSLVGLPMPDRAMPDRAMPDRATPDRVDRMDPVPVAPRAAPVVVEATPSARPITVRAGDTLWSIAAASLDDDANVAEVDAAWRALYAANREVIGSDPDLIRPGLNLDPGPNREEHP